MTSRITVDLIDRVKADVRDLLRDAARRLPHLAHADCRIEVVEGKSAAAENGESKFSGDDYGFTAGVRVLAGDRMVAPGWVGLTLGTADMDDLLARLREALERAHHRALVNGEMKAAAREKFGALGVSLTDTRLHAVEVREDTVRAVYALDPRALALAEMVAFTTDVSKRVAAFDPAIKHNYISTLTQLSRELFASSEGALIDQSFALTQGMCYVIGVEGQVSQELYDVLGHQRGWEILAGGVDDPLLGFPPFVDFALAMARDSVELARAPALPTSAGDEVVVTDPHYNTLLSHEIVGHPVELDRALKMETAYAGRSWLLAGLDDHQVGRRIASPLVSAYSDPSLPGYGHYVYDHEGTPARRVTHIERGIFTGFMNSRQTAAVFGGAPNGHFKAVDASLVPLIRMSNTVFAAGERDAGDIVKEIDRGWYLMGHRIPSIAESRENFRISARKVYEIRNGQRGRLYRDGGIMADSRDFLLHVDAVGSDFRLYPIPNCGKGQPMQSKKLGNGGPTLRSRARLAGG
ncbi:MAG TPA: TldD/PmbA family protein [Methylomirabilota bacterium]|jgi:TldD protein|nr:TldD/PmbA family protein [Methylomirabilota bacterium]